MMATLSYPENTAKSSFNHYKSFPGIFKPAQPLTCFRKLISGPNCTVSVLNNFYLHTCTQAFARQHGHETTVLFGSWDNYNYTT